MRSLSNIGSFLLGLGVPVVFDGIRLDQGSRYHLGIALCIGGLVVFLAGIFYSFGGNGDLTLRHPCPKCMMPITVEDIGRQSQRLLCELCGWTAKYLDE